MPMKYMRETKILLSGMALAFLAMGALAPLAFAQAYPQGQNVGMTLEDQLRLARERIQEVRENPGAGSGTPYLDASGVIGATIISGSIFGGIFVAFVVRAKQIEKRMQQNRALQ